GPQAFDLGRFLAALEEQLVAEAEAKVGTLGGQPVLERLPETLRLEDAHAVAKGALTGKDQQVEAVEIAGLRDQLRRRANGGEGVEHAAQVAGAVIQHAELHRTFLVLGMPVTRGSMRVAASSARARPLKMAS